MACKEALQWQMVGFAKQCLAALCSGAEALRILRRMELDGHRSFTAYSAAISSCAGQWQQALEILVTAQGAQLRPSAVMLSAFIGVCAQQSVWQAALQWHLPAVAGATIHACERASQWERASATVG